ncbi:peptidoglycan hydrolase [Streptococcus gallolyticus subsp. gallolyticus]|uniref:lytic exoenzyme target recognition domain-containing protein n=1 Tax=Streptococcus gallolyticus TaxID=315405 RepID=UPI0022839D9E|nr:lytic exoenzyme target recognition domain-containing protein [Streptococcus gallolyticus]MCY7171794.1 peptidoglycan hydrolase [Streptococcus gallolyticus subsp. gallolyticus]
MNTDVLINWFESRRGKLTYSMYGSRNGSDGTADCSGSISQALKEAGVNIIGLPSTVTLGSQLAKNGFYRVSKNEDWNGQRGDIVMMSWGADMSQSGGAGGHVGVLEDANTFISVDYSTGGQRGTAVSSHNWDGYYNSSKPTYIEAWRYSGSTATQANTVVSPTNTRKPDSKAYYLANQVAFVNGIYQIKCDYLAPIGFNYVDNGIPVGLVNWVDENGNNLPDGQDKDFKAGMYFSFEIDEAHITDTGEGGYYGGYYWRKFEFGQFGTVWLSCRDKDDLVNYYK